jgi:hypothetical protein
MLKIKIFRGLPGGIQVLKLHITTASQIVTIILGMEFWLKYSVRGASGDCALLRYYTVHL